jgi:two-component system response regulator AdeR
MGDVASKVLIVEDSVELAEIITAVVEQMALHPIHVINGAKAIEVIQAEKPDLILLDLFLPDIVGWRILDAAKDAIGSFNTPVIVITAAGDPANRLMGKLRDVVAYLIKPCTPEEVEEVINRALALQDAA